MGEPLLSDSRDLILDNRFSMKGSRYSILAGIENRVENQTVNLLLNGTVRAFREASA